MGDRSDVKEMNCLNVAHTRFNTSYSQISPIPMETFRKVLIHVRVWLASPAGLGFQWVKLVRVWSVKSRKYGEILYIRAWLASQAPRGALASHTRTCMGIPPNLTTISGIFISIPAPTSSTDLTLFKALPPNNVHIHMSDQFIAASGFSPHISKPFICLHSTRLVQCVRKVTVHL
jgi:hypothetical protein